MSPRRKRRPSRGDRFEPQIVRLRTRYRKTTVQRIFEELQREGYDGGTSIAFEHLGGVAVSRLYDNMKVVLSRYEDGEPVYSPRFLAFATRYGFRPIACRVRRPQAKGKVERPFDNVERNLLNGREFQSLEHLNDVTRWWLEHVAESSTMLDDDGCTSETVEGDSPKFHGDGPSEENEPETGE